MFAIAFDLVVRETAARHPRSVSQAYTDIANALGEFGFQRVQGSVYMSYSEDLANLFRAIGALRSIPWFALCVRDIRAFRVEQWSDFTPIIKGR